MTDEERQKLCATLRRMPGMLRHDCIRAADEIERLTKEVEFWKTKAEQSLDMLTAYQLNKADNHPAIDTYGEPLPGWHFDAAGVLVPKGER